MKIAPELHGTCDERFSAVRDAFAAIVSECDALIGNDRTCASRVTEIPYIYLDEVTGGASCDHYDHSRTAGQGTSSITSESSSARRSSPRTSSATSALGADAVVGVDIAYEGVGERNDDGIGVRHDCADRLRRRNHDPD